MDKRSEVFEFKTLIREEHLDTFGHVNNARYLELFEQARWDFITPRGYGLKEVQALKKGPVILEANIKFKQELRLREEIRIESYVTQMKGKIGYIEQQLYNQKGEVSAVANFVVGFFDLSERKLILPTPEWLKAIGWS